MPQSFGLLNIDKPAGMTSRDAVNIVQRLVRPAKAGHAGTLDPIATGVLVVCIGPATRLISFVQDSRKVYQATFQLGVTSETDDIEGDVRPLSGAPRLTRSEIAAVLPDFLGTIQQIPPAHSAVHVNGRRAYELARRGVAFELTPRTVEVARIEILHFDETNQDLGLEIECGSGTYIRSLGRDIAAKLGTAAVMTELRRTAVGPFQASEAICPKRLSPESIASALQPACLAVASRPRISLASRQVEAIRHGRRISLPNGTRFGIGEEIALVDESDTLVGIAVFDERDATLRPRIVLPAA